MEDRQCKECGSLISSETDSKFCNACVLKSALRPTEVVGGEVELESAEKSEAGSGGWEGLLWTQDKLPRWVDRYRLVRQIGEGAFGIVYAAEQREPIRRQVAVKIVKPGHESEEILARFDAERQALALMDHPNVAHVLDGGQTSNGRPYFVMELVRGEPLSSYCRRVRPSLRELLRLFTQICEGVGHAHQRGIIHRDLKPTNILVEGEAESATPKVIDFGIAKATGALLTERTILTQTGQLLGTLEYMSPEQALTSGLDVDVRSDVYSLGAVLYELLCGRPPIQRMRKADYKLNEILEKIEKELPAKPSAITDARVFLREGTNLLRASDLDWIVLKALDKERSRRYETPTDFASDIATFLDGRPVLARAPTIAYKSGKFLRRNWKSVSAAAAVIFVIAGSLISLKAQRRRE